MTQAQRIEINQSRVAYRDISNKVSTKTCGHTEGLTQSRPSFVSRMAQLIFRREHHSTVEEQRPKSWTGQSEPTPATAAPATLVRHASASIIIPNRSTESARLTSRWTRARPVNEHTADSGDTCSDASWRERQTHCTNCERLFFTSLSRLSSSAGRFCSLDCKTNFEYVSELQQALNVHMQRFSEASASSSSSSSWSSLSEEEVEVRVHGSLCSEGALRF